MSTQEVPEWLRAAIDNFDKRCPKCSDEGHGGDGCSYCWDHSVVREAEERLIQIILSHMIDKQKVEELLDEQHEASRATAYEDVASRAGSGNNVRRYAESRAEKIRQALNIRKEE